MAGENGGPASSSGSPNSPPADEGPWQYVGVGCLTTFAGLAGGGMIAVLIAKIVGWASRCPVEPETGAPCNWFVYAVYGAITGAILVPVISIWFLRRSRIRARNSERG